MTKLWRVNRTQKIHVYADSREEAKQLAADEPEANYSEPTYHPEKIGDKGKQRVTQNDNE